MKFQYSFSTIFVRVQDFSFHGRQALVLRAAIPDMLHGEKRIAYGSVISASGCQECSSLVGLMLGKMLERLAAVVNLGDKWTCRRIAYGSVMVSASGCQECSCLVGVLLGKMLERFSCCRELWW